MNPKADEIRKRMLQVRTDIDDDVDELVVAAKSFVDWKEYVRSAPWATVGLAVAAGFLVVPTKKKSLSTSLSLPSNGDSNSAAKFVRSEKPSMLKVLFGNLAASTVRLAVSQIGKQVTTMLAGQGGAGASPPHRDTGRDSEREGYFQDTYQ